MSRRHEPHFDAARWKVGDPLPPVLTAPEAAALLRTTRQTIYQMVARGELEGNGGGGKGKPVRIWSASVVDWVRGKGRAACGGSEGRGSETAW